MKTLDEVIKDMEQCKYLDSDCSQCPALHYLKEYRTLQYGYIKAMADLEDNPPLTWDELKQIVGKPVWVEYESCDRKVWAIIDCFYTDAFQKVKMNVALPHDYWNLEKEMMGVTWKAYRKERE